MRKYEREREGGGEKELRVKSGEREWSVGRSELLKWSGQREVEIGLETERRERVEKERGERIVNRIRESSGESMETGKGDGDRESGRWRLD